MTGDYEQSHDSKCVPAELFELLWSTLNDVMGSAATATMMRRAIKHASARLPELGGISITRTQFEYRYALPDSWQSDGCKNLASLQALTMELEPILAELTGIVVLRRLRTVQPLRRCGLFGSEVVQ